MSSSPVEHDADVEQDVDLRAARAALARALQRQLQILERALVAPEAEAHQAAPLRSGDLPRVVDVGQVLHRVAEQQLGLEVGVARERAVREIQVQPPGLVACGRCARRGTPSAAAAGCRAGAPGAGSSRRPRGGSRRARRAAPPGTRCRAAASGGTRAGRRGGAPGSRSRSGGAGRCWRRAATRARRRRDRAPAARPRAPRR